MSQTTAQFLLETRGTQRELDAFVVAACFDRAGGTVAFALGDGTLRLVSLTDRESWRSVDVHDGAALSLAPDATSTGFVSGGDDGKFRRVGADATTVADFRSKWVEHVASHAGEKGKGLLACAVGKNVQLFDQGGAKLKELTHPSTVTGLVFDARGKRVCASHYNGASLWFVNAKEDSPRKLEWKGSHTGIAIHPDGDAVVTAMQENALHGWRLSDNQHMRMSGYPSKTASMSFTRNGKWLATSGADAMVLWPFFGGGPMGKAPIELAGGDGVVCTRVAAHPRDEMVAGGFADGLIVLADVNSSRVLPVAPPGRGPVSALAWSPDGSQLAFGTESGLAAIIDLAKRA
ncbi:MAG TPA: WD40 repeat domain-containing protein [Acetobacteraceae bacterium]|nr:WD40 repeat domain-containing protein [Acetobacteraceae bacterium]